MKAIVLMCFVDAEWGFFSSPFKVDGVRVTWGKAAAEAVKQPGPVREGKVLELGQMLAGYLESS